MWIATNKGFISIVQHRAEPGHFMIRARRAECLRAIFPDEVPQYTPLADYHWRITATKDKAIAAVIAALSTIRYNNFKASVEDQELLAAYHYVWEDMRALQAPLARPKAA
jgi:hypothetical protein